jgi:spore coat protein CotF
MEDTTKIPLISSEITGLWNSYMSDTMIVCVLKHFLNNVDDSETRAILQQISDLSNQHIQELTIIFNQEKLTIPDGFTDNDVNISAPRLFTDTFYLDYLSFMAKASMHNYTLILNHIARSDIRAYFSKRIQEAIDLYNNSADLRLAKGIFIRAPRVEVSHEVQYVKSQSFLTDLFGEKRPLLTAELTHIFALIFSNLVGRAISIGFGQVSKNKKVSDYFFEGKSVSTDYIDEFTKLLTDEGIPIPSSSDSFVTDSTDSPYSEKLMMSHSALLCSSAISSLGMAMADTMRGDLGANYVKHLAQIMKYTRKGVDIMIDNGWLQQPPQVIKHENLVSV